MANRSYLNTKYLLNNERLQVNKKNAYLLILVMAAAWLLGINYGIPEATMVESGVTSIFTAALLGIIFTYLLKQKEE